MAADTGSRKNKKKGAKQDKPAEPEAAEVNEASQDAEACEAPGTMGETDLLARCHELEAKALRAHADYQNLRRRAQADLEAGIKRQMQPLIEDLLLVLDFLDMALASPATNEETKNLAIGVEMTRNKFVQALEASDVLVIDTSGRFDPALHDASEALENPDQEPGTILATLRRGYKWHEQVLRPAQVRVVAGDLKASDPEDEEGNTEEASDTTTEADTPEEQAD